MLLLACLEYTDRIRAMELAIETRGLTRDFGAFRALDDLNLAVPRGIVFGFLGPNGAGKTTTIRILLGLLRPTRGEVWTLGCRLPQEVSRLRPRVGVLLESSGVYARLSVKANLEFFGALYGLPPQEVRARARELLEVLGLSELSSRLGSQLSTGERRKLGIARALLHRPELLFLDEPTAGLDAPSTVALHESLQRLVRQEGITVFLTTHHLEEAERLCSRVAVLRRGRLLAEGSPQELAARFQKPLVVVRGQGFERLIEQIRGLPGVVSVEQAPGELRVLYQDRVESAALNRFLVTSGAEVEELVKDRGEFEQAFLELVREEA
jgi:ABC-2 type transport system ATP-binding protein